MTAIAPVASLLNAYNSWKKPIFIAAIALSVASAVVAIFISSYFAAIGFALCGVSTFVLYTEDGSSEAQLAGLATQIHQDNDLLKTETDKIAALTAQMAQQGAVFQKNREALERNVRQFQDEINALKGAQRNWEVAQQTLHGENQRLIQTKTALETELGTLKAALDAAQKQMQQFFTQNYEFGKKVGAFQGNEVELQAAVGQLNGIGQGFGELDRQLAAGTKIMQGMGQFYAARQQNLDGDLARFKGDVEQLQAREASLRELSEKLDKRAAEMAQMNEQFKRAEEALDGEPRQLLEQVKHLEAERRGFEADTEKYKTLRGEIQEIVELGKQELAELEITKQLKLQQIKDLDLKLQEKLKELAKR